MLVGKQANPGIKNPADVPAIVEFYAMLAAQLETLARAAVGNSPAVRKLRFSPRNVHNKWQNSLLLWYLGVDPPSNVLNYYHTKPQTLKSSLQAGWVASIGPVVAHGDMYDKATHDPTAASGPPS